MNMGWSSIGVQCDQCGKPTQLMEANVSADGEFQFIGACHECETMTKWRVYISTLQWQALRNDLEREKADAQQKPGMPVKPPIVRPRSKPQDATNFDNQFEHDCGIDPE